jgi:hypothetical protein
LKEKTMADDAPGTLTVPDITIVGQPESQGRVKFLNYLAWNPAEALRNWGRLSQDDQAYIEAMMQLHYGADFVQMFDAKASTDPRPDASIVMINDPSMTPQRLRSAGFRYMGDPGGVPVWVHPTGQQVWLMSDPNAAPAPSIPAPDVLPQSQPPTHPDVEESQKWADNFESRFNDLQQQYLQLEQLRDPDTGTLPRGPLNDYRSQWEKLDDDLRSVLYQEADLWDHDGLTDDEKAALQEARQRIQTINNQMPDIENAH